MYERISTVYCICFMRSHCRLFKLYSVQKTKADMQKLVKQHELDIEKEREKYAMEKERMEIEHRHQLELLQKESENTLGTSVTNTLITEAMKIPEIREQFSQGVKNGSKRKIKR